MMTAKAQSWCVLRTEPKNSYIQFFTNFVSQKLITKTAQGIFLKIGMKFGDKKGKKIAAEIFCEKISFCPNLAKSAKK